MKPIYKIYLFATVVFVIKCLLLPFVQVTDADAVTRTLITLNWMEDPYVMDTANWAPFHFYLNAGILFFWKNAELAPVFLNILLSSLLLIPFYHYLKREYNEHSAFYGVLFLSLSPIILRTGFLALAETPFLLSLILAINTISKSIRENKLKWIFIAGFFMTLSAGFRYDAWVLIAIFSLGIWVSSNFKTAFYFGLVSSLFPVYWMLSNYLVTGNALHSIEANFYYTHELVGINDHVSFSGYLRRIWFFPFSLLIGVGPIIFYFAFKSFFADMKNFKLSGQQFILINVLLIWMIYFYQAIQGNLLLHHRFTGTLILFSIPLALTYFNELSKIKIRLALFSVSFTILLTYVYNMGGISPVPRLKNQEMVEAKRSFENKLNENTGLLIDFIGWEESYYLGLNSGISPKQIYFVNGEINSSDHSNEIKSHLNRYPENIIILKKNSERYRFVKETVTKKTDTLYQDKDLLIIHYQQ